MAYKAVTEIPQVPDLVVQTDSRRQAVLLPIYGTLVPFHICTIKSIDTSSTEGESAIIRVTFHTPGMASAANYEPALKVRTMVQKWISIPEEMLLLLLLLLLLKKTKKMMTMMVMMMMMMMRRRM